MKFSTTTAIILFFAATNSVSSSSLCGLQQQADNTTPAPTDSTTIGVSLDNDVCSNQDNLNDVQKALMNNLFKELS